MCGRFVYREVSWAEYYESLTIIKTSQTATDSYNVKPTQPIKIIYQGEDRLQEDVARWWFVPHWHRKDVKDWKATTFNARIETANDLPVFRYAWRSGRCAIPATGYYEWTGEKGSKQPWYITIEQNEPMMFFAGLMSTLSNNETTCAILTRDASEDLAELHHRMPVILNSDELMAWLTYDAADAEIIDTFGTKWDGDFKFWKVRPFGTKDDGLDLIDEVLEG